MPLGLIGRDENRVQVARCRGFVCIAVFGHDVGLIEIRIRIEVRQRLKMNDVETGGNLRFQRRILVEHQNLGKIAVRAFRHEKCDLVTKIDQ